MKKLTSKKIVSTSSTKKCTAHKITKGIKPLNILDDSDKYLFEDTIFEKDKVLKLAVSKTYLPEGPSLLEGLYSDDNFSTVLMRNPNCDEGASFIKAGGFLKDGSFLIFYALLWKERAIVSNNIELSDTEITFFSPSAKHCNFLEDWMHSVHSGWSKDSEKLKKSGTLPLGQGAIDWIKDTCYHWDELFLLKSDALMFNNGYTKKSLDFYEVGEGDGVWSRNQAADGFREIIDISFHWPFPVVFRRKIWWTVG